MDNEEHRITESKRNAWHILEIIGPIVMTLGLLEELHTPKFFHLNDSFTEKPIFNFFFAKGH